MFCSLLCQGKANAEDFSETVALIVGRCKHLIDLIICKYSRLMSFLDLGPRSFTYEN